MQEVELLERHAEQPAERVAGPVAEGLGVGLLERRDLVREVLQALDVGGADAGLAPELSVERRVLPGVGHELEDAGLLQRLDLLPRGGLDLRLQEPAVEKRGDGRLG